MSAQKPAPKSDAIKVTVTFPIAQGGPFHEDVPPTETVANVRTAAMAGFGVAEDAEHHYYLTHSGSQVDDSTTVGSVAGHAHAVTFTLVKELVQG